MRAVLGGLCLFFFGTLTAYAGVIVHVSHKGAADAKAKDQEVVYAQDGLLRIDKLDDHGQVRDLTLVRDQ